MSMVLSPDKSHVFLHAYHVSSKFLIPGSALSLLGTCMMPSNHTDDCGAVKTLHSANVLNVGYHSYVSVSCVISDYIQHPRLEKVARLCNLKSHSVACAGFLWFVWAK